MAKIFNIGIIGFGKRSKDGLCKSMRNYGELVGRRVFRVTAVTDVRPEDVIRTDLESIGFGDARIYSDPDDMYKNEQQFYRDDGIVGAGVEATIQNVGRLGKIGMKLTNEEIIKIMIGQ